uniref:BTB domain-containing protein n=1 Tax=Syphacia muris TaxID=451379 RepID=A0A0N5AMB9_9BILA
MQLADNIGALFLDSTFCDVKLKVSENVIPAHRIILGSRSQYFRALLYNGMKETKETEIELLDTPYEAFKHLLSYMYTGKMTLYSLKEEAILDILCLAHKYGFVDLEESISEYLKVKLNVCNVCDIYGTAHSYSLTSLIEFCLNFADKNAGMIILSPGFLQLPASAIVKMIQRDSFCAPEIEIFKADQESEQIVSQLRLPLMTLSDLLNIVRTSGLISADLILDAIKEQQERKSVELTSRGFLLPNINVATSTYNARVINGEGGIRFLNSDTCRYDMEHSVVSHLIHENSQGIVVELDRPYNINHLRLLLWDRDQRVHRYYVEVSMSGDDWVRVIDHTKYHCRSLQRLYFSPRVIKFIRVVGTYNTVSDKFHLVSMEAMYTTDSFKVDPISTLLIPSSNVATTEKNAIVIEGVCRSRDTLLSAERASYDWDNGYTCHQLGCGAIVVQLPQPYLIDSMRLLLWDCDNRYYSYYIDISCDNVSWCRVVDRTAVQCKSWQYVQFERCSVVYVRIVGTYNSANEVFHCVRFECPGQPLAKPPKDSFENAGVETLENSMQ